MCVDVVEVCVEFVLCIVIVIVVYLFDGVFIGGYDGVGYDVLIVVFELDDVGCDIVLCGDGVLVCFVVGVFGSVGG